MPPKPKPHTRWTLNLSKTFNTKLTNYQLITLRTGNRHITFPMPLSIFIFQMRDMRQGKRVQRCQVNNVMYDLQGKEMAEILQRHSCCDMPS